MSDEYSNSKLQGEPKITPHSLQRIYAAIGMTFTLKECQQFLKSHLPPSSFPSLEDPDSVSMSFSSFLLFFSNTKHMSCAQEYKSIFQLLDHDWDGYVEIGVLRNVLLGYESIAPPLPTKDLTSVNYQYHIGEGGCKEERVEKMMRKSFGTRCDNPEEKISYQEFVDFLYT